MHEIAPFPSSPHTFHPLFVGRGGGGSGTVFCSGLSAASVWLKQNGFMKAAGELVGQVGDIVLQQGLSP